MAQSDPSPPPDPRFFPHGNYNAQSPNNQTTRVRSSSSELSLGESGPGDRKSGELAMSGRWRDHESPPHFSPRAELGWRRGVRRGLEPAPPAPEPPRSRSPVPRPASAREGRSRPLPSAAGGRHRRSRGKSGRSRAKRPASRAPGCRVCLPARALPPPGAAFCASPAAPASSSQRAALQPGQPLGGPFTPKSEEVQLRAARRLAAAVGSRGASASRNRAQRRGVTFPRERAPGAPRRWMPEARGQTRSVPFPRPPKLSALPGRTGDSPGMFGPDSSGAGGQLTSPPSPPGGRGPAGSLRSAHGVAPAPHPPSPSVKSVTAFLPPDLLQSLHTVARSWELMPGALAPPGALPRPPTTLCAGPGRGEEAARRGHLPLSAAHRPLPAPRAFPSPSGCRLPVPLVLIPRS